MQATRRLGPWLVFCIVYADIGTSVYYVPGILYGDPHGLHGPPHGIGELATLAQLLTLGVFISITLKYAEICARCPDGGGVVSIAEQAFPKLPSLALIGGAMITIDYFLTSAISGTSGIYYLQTVAPFGKSLVVPITVACLGALIVLNIVGLKESASVTAVMTVIKLIVNALLITLSAAKITRMHAWTGEGGLLQQVFHPSVKLTATTLLVTPSEEATTIQARAYEILQQRWNLLAIPIWRLGDAALAIAEAAAELKARTVVVGASKRGAIWHLLRGNVLKGLLKRLPADTRLLISS